MLCPFINGQCREDCVFRLKRKVASENGTTVCRLVISTETSEHLCDILIQKNQEKTQK